MIRREQDGHYLLITQHDHAQLAGELASHVGNVHFARPDPYQPTVTGVRLHDCGWPLHDDSPTVNDRGQPRDFMETPRDLAISIWHASAERAAEKDPYAGLLTSLHVLALSVMATDRAPAGSSWDLSQPPSRFAIVKFQHRQIEFQETLRERLGFRCERTTGGRHQPAEGSQRSEDQLQYNFRLLQVMDLLSLGICCGSPPAAETMELYTAPAGAGRRLRMSRRGNDLLVDPWPFDIDTIDLQIPVCRVHGGSFLDDADMRRAYAAGSAEILPARVLPA